MASYEHDCGWFIGNDVRRQELIDWLVAAVSVPRPAVGSVDIDPDPRLELGDKITVKDPARTGLELDLVITGIRQSWGASAPSMNLSGRVTRMARPVTPLEPVNAWATLLAGWNG